LLARPRSVGTPSHHPRFIYVSKWLLSYNFNLLRKKNNVRFSANVVFNRTISIMFVIALMKRG
jgi:hypothetical protein